MLVTPKDHKALKAIERMLSRKSRGSTGLTREADMSEAKRTLARTAMGARRGGRARRGKGAPVKDGEVSAPASQHR